VTSRDTYRLVGSALADGISDGTKAAGSRTIPSAKADPTRALPPAPSITRLFRLTIPPGSVKSYVPFVRRHLRRAAKLLRSPLRELTVAFVNDSQMTELHEQFMGLRSTTDVLTFPIDEDRRGRAVSGEVYVCIPEARRQARLRGIPVQHEVLLYALHGMLHLSGFDDRTHPEYRRMHRREDQILTRLGIGSVFASPASSSATDGTRSVPATSRRRHRRRRRATARRKSG
jgi:probable rRNA maturation factor